MTAPSILLGNEVRRHQLLYDAGCPEISDAEFDGLVEQLRRMSPFSAVLLELGHAVSGRKSSHLHPMLSLQKVYTAKELLTWARPLKKRSPTFLLQPKYDGLALSVTYREGALYAAQTRGDGRVGDDVTEVVRAANLVPLRILTNCRWVNVRGEVLLSKEVFTERFSTFANARNLVAGFMARHVSNAVPDLSFADFIAYDLNTSVSDPDPASPALYPDHQDVKLEFLEKLGFKIGRYEMVSFDDLCDRVLQPWETPYEIDGLVVKVHDRKLQADLGETEHHPRWSVAWKYQGESGMTTLVNVEWEVSRLGTITPVAVMEPVALSGVVITRATMHNATRFCDLGPIHVGAKVCVTRRGGVIPHIETVSPGPGARLETPAYCPACGLVTQRRSISSMGTTSVQCGAPKHCPGVIRERILFWCRATGMLGIGPERIADLYRVKLVKSIIDLYRLPEYRSIAAHASFGPIEWQNMLNAIDTTRVLEPAIFLQALGIKGLGKTLSRQLAKTIDWETLRVPAGVRKVLGEVQDELLLNQDLIDTLLIYVRLEHTEVDTKTILAQSGGIFAGKKIVFTGELSDMSRDAAKLLVEEYGGESPSAVTKDTNILVISDKAILQRRGSVKRSKALALQAQGHPIEILSETEFSRRVAEATPYLADVKPSS